MGIAVMIYHNIYHNLILLSYICLYTVENNTNINVMTVAPWSKDWEKDHYATAERLITKLLQIGNTYNMGILTIILLWW